MRIRALFQICIHSRTCRTSILEDATFHKMIWCSSFEESLQDSRDILRLLDFCISLILLSSICDQLPSDEDVVQIQYSLEFLRPSYS